jgi:hypothetical protein
MERDRSQEHRRRRDERMAKVAQLIGDTCIDCGSTDRIEYDHVDPSTKFKSIVQMAYTSGEERFWAEVEKCVPRCHDCHMDKTLRDAGKTRATGRHGTTSTYRYCKCNECRAAAALYRKNLRHKYATLDQR